MKTKLALLLAIAGLCAAPELYAQSAIYACGHIRRNRTEAYDNLRNSGYTTAIIFNVTVEEDGTLTTDYDWKNQRPAETGGIICRDGEYVFGEVQPQYVSDVQSLLKQPTSISRLEFCIGGWGNGSYSNIRKLVERDGTGPETILYRNFKALKEAIPEVVAINNDQEQDYNVEAATAFHRMMAEIGYKTTIAPYTNKTFWQTLVANLNETPGTCDIVYLQTYGGGSGNNPASWKVFGDIPMYVGFDCESSSSRTTMERKFKNWKENADVQGGFLWNYNDERRNLNEWATAINRIFPTVKAEKVAATVYGNADFGGYAVELPAGEFSQPEMALYGVTAKDVASLKVTPGYTVTLYKGRFLDGDSRTWTEDAASLADGWADAACSLRIAPGSGIGDIDADGATTIGGEGEIIFHGEAGEAKIYDLQGRLLKTLCTTTASTRLPMPRGLYLVTTASGTAKIAVR